MDLSIILTGRDDNYGENFIERLARTLKNHIVSLELLDLDYEIIMVDFNPYGDKYLQKHPLLEEYLSNPKVKNVVVDRSVILAEQLSPTTFYEYFAKNVGARASSGDLLMLTNSDIIFSWELMHSIAQAVDDPEKNDVFYRTRWRHEMNLNDEFLPPTDTPALDLYEPRNPDGHLCATYSGDATMLSREVFFNVATGYNEGDPGHRTSANQSSMDGEILWNVWNQGKTLKFLEGPYYHISHGRPEPRDATYNNGTYKNRPDWGMVGYSWEQEGNVIMVTAPEQEKEKLVINKQEVTDFDRVHLYSTAAYEGNSEFHHFLDPAGTSEYNLYAYLSHKFDNTTILDIGTRHGNSAIAFSSNPSNKVITFDVVQWESYEGVKKDNIDLRLGDFMQDATIDYNNVSIIMIDVDPHDGLQEPPMLDFLRRKQWKGILLLDDISQTLWPAIYSMWITIPEEKFDVTDIAHFSGTGLVNFGGKFDIEIVD